MTAVHPHVPADSGPSGTSGPSVRGLGLVAVGGTLGTLARYLLDGFIGAVAGFPLGIFVVNVTGAFLLGVLVEALARRGPDRGARRDLRLLLGTGVLGGYTTYSLLAVDVVQLAAEARLWQAVCYGVATVVVGGMASWAGILVGGTRGDRS